VLPSIVGVLGACALAAACALSLYSYGQVRRQRTQVAALQRQLDAQVGALRNRNASLAGRVASTQRRLARKDAGIAPLAAQVLKSVFTIETPGGWLGAGFAAWTEDGDTYFVTANHVVSHSGTTNNYVSVKRKGGSWSGEIMRRDRANDLALVRVSGRPAGATPLWQRAEITAPRAGDQLLLVGSPYGLEGTVTTGIVSRVTRRAIQTDAAANPGNSGGPALDRSGRVVGVLLSGGGENLNFAVPIARACMALRAC
jgi:S1-C subfamily serine protease